MSTAGRTDDDEQQVTFPIEDALAIRGALNIVELLLERPGFETSAFPITAAQLPVLNRLRSRLNNNIEQSSDIDEPEFRDVLDPAEAQLIRDATGTVTTMLGDPGGREILDSLGVNITAAEEDCLEELADRIEPTGVRPALGPGVETRGAAAEADRDVGEIINPSRPLGEIIVQAEREIAEGTLPWPGVEQAIFMLASSEDAGGVNPAISDCEDLFKGLVADIKLTVAGSRRLEAGTRELGEFREHVRDALDADILALDDVGCITDNEFETLRQVKDGIVVNLQQARAVDDASTILDQIRRISEAGLGEQTALEMAGERREQRLIETVNRLRDELRNLPGETTPDELADLNQRIAEFLSGMDVDDVFCENLYDFQLQFLEAVIGASTAELPDGTIETHEQLILNERGAGCLNQLEANELEFYWDDILQGIRNDEREILVRATMNYLSQLRAAITNPRN